MPSNTTTCNQSFFYVGYNVLFVFKTCVIGCALVSGLACRTVFCNTLKDIAVQMKIKYVGQILSARPLVVFVLYK